jgi:hypothetical protein
MAARKGKEATVTVTNISTEDEWQELMDKQVVRRSSLGKIFIFNFIFGESVG